MKKTLYSAVAFLLLGLGISLQIKAGIGQSMFNAFCLLLADLLRIEIGTVINFLNLVFFLVYIYMQPSSPKLKDITQFIAILANGYVINLFTYSVLTHFIIQSYYFKIMTFILGLFLSSISLGAILAMGLIRFPLEGVCIVLSQKLKCSLTKMRMMFDIFFLISTLTLTLITNHTLFIREGTLISFLLLSRLLGFSYDFHFKKFIKRNPNCVWWYYSTSCSPQCGQCRIDVLLPKCLSHFGHFQLIKENRFNVKYQIIIYISLIF